VEYLREINKPCRRSKNLHKSVSKPGTEETGPWPGSHLPGRHLDSAGTAKGRTEGSEARVRSSRGFARRIRQMGEG